MELPLLFRAPNPASATLTHPARAGLGAKLGAFSTKSRRRVGVKSVRASGETGGDGVDGGREEGGVGVGVGASGSGSGLGFMSPTMEVTTFNQGFGEAEFPIWDKIGAVVRLSYGIGIYGAMALAGRFICSVTGIDSMGGLHPTLDAVIEGLGYAAPPIMALLFILDDEVVKFSPHARAIRDVEDEELRSFFYGMSPWQFMLIVAASSVGEELFYRAAVQGALADIFLRGTELMTDATGMASLTGVLPPFVPFAQAYAAAITAALTGSLYYMAASPKDPTYVVAPVLQSRSGKEDLKKLFAAWYERRQMKKIYSPLLEGLLALYLGFEWIQTGNLLSPIITHGIYSAVILGHGLWKIHDHKRRLRQRIQRLQSEGIHRNLS
uniref:CAAX prenyl protease 2/Lysostaphin resistance protein A-like domain-containing protein n=1 Tax=Kalanchoe fedtschenkoi TaxID=63787 RepID=A0A7N0TBD1_KALFE